MKLNLVTTAALLAVTGALMTQSAKAQFAGNSGDLILSFADNVGTDTGATMNYEIDLGQFSTYTGASSTINIANIATDLTSVYGSSWYSNADLQLGIVGVVNNGALGGVKNDTVFVSDTSTSPYAAKSGSALGNPVSAAGVLYNPASGTPAPTNGSTANSYEVPTSNGASFTTKLSAFSADAPNLETTFGLGTAPTLYLDTLQPGATSFVTGTSAIAANGHFDITSGGEVQYDVPGVAVPEPSTYGLMMLGGALLFFWQARRKSVSRL
jgi:hypothetical protein